MSGVYLSPSLNSKNPFADGGNEEYYMNLIADETEHCLTACKIPFRRSRPRMTLSQAIDESNSANCDLHLAIHSTSAPESKSERCTGANIYHYPTSAKGKRFAEKLQSNYKKIYPEPDDVVIISSEKPEELRRTKAPAVMIEVGFHDNLRDARWIRENIGSIGRAIAKAVADYLSTPFIEP